MVVDSLATVETRTHEYYGHTHSGDAVASLNSHERWGKDVSEWVNGWKKEGGKIFFDEKNEIAEEKRSRSKVIHYSNCTVYYYTVCGAK